MGRRLWRTAAARWAACLATVGVAFVSPPANGAAKLRVATLAPKRSAWGKVYLAWAKAIEDKTSGALTVQFLWNGVGGPSSGIVHKIADGQLEGGSLSLTDLARYYSDVFAIELPGTTTSGDQIDRVRTVVEPELSAALATAGVRFQWWEDSGRVRLFTRGYAARRPSDLTNKRLSSWSSVIADDPIIAETIATVRGTYSTILPSPKTPADFFIGPSMPVSPFGFDHVNERVLWCGTAGAMVLGKSAVDSLPSDLAQVIQGTSGRVTQALASAVRRDDDTAYAEIARKIAVVTHTPGESSEWNALFFQVATRLAQKKLDKATVNRVHALRGLPPVP